MGALGTWLVGLAAPAVRQILISLGIGVVSFAALSTALNLALSSAKSAFSGFTGDALNLFMLSGAHTALSIIAGAMVARVALIQLKRFQVLA
jgi:hypothetical protein